MKEPISLTVPMDYNALMRASKFLKDLAGDIKAEMWNGGGKPMDDISAFQKVLRDGDQNNEGDLVDNSGAPAATIEQITQAEINAGNLSPTETSAASAFADESVDESTGEMLGNDQVVQTATVPATAQLATTTKNTAVIAKVSDVAQNAAAPVGVELDADNLPWDSRINPVSKLKLKKTNQWKIKRGLDPTFVTQVQDELRAAMAASPANPIVTETTPSEPSSVQSAIIPAPAPTATPAAAPVQAVEPAPVETVETPGTITTLPELMSKVTAAGILPAAVLAAANKLGLASPALLGARPDLIPAIAAELFPAGT